jgi:hypothetical protein
MPESGERVHRSNFRPEKEETGQVLVSPYLDLAVRFTLQYLAISWVAIIFCLQIVYDACRDSVILVMFAPCNIDELRHANQLVNGS